MNYLQISIECILFCLESFLCFIFCNVFCKDSKKINLRVILSIIISSILITLINYNYEMFSPIDLILTLFVLILTQVVIFGNEFYRIVSSVFVFRGIAMTTTYTALSIGHQFAGFNYAALDNSSNIIFTQRDFPLFVSEVILTIIIFAFRNTTISINYISKHTKVSAIILSAMLFVVYLLFPWFGDGEVYCFAYQYVSSNIPATIEFLTVILFMTLVMYQIIKPIASNLYKRQLDIAEIKATMLKNSLDETEQSFALWRQSIHDYKNNIIALTQLAEDGKLDEIKAYLDKENELLDRRMFYIKTGNLTADAIINTKYSKAQIKDINFAVNAQLDNCPISDIDLARILGNLLDNAIESSENETEPYITVNISKQKSFLIINITNKFTGEFTDITKKDRNFHGIGTKSIKRIVNKYNGEFTINCNDNEVSAKILIP